jgi:hypothetical protein
LIQLRHAKGGEKSVGARFLAKYRIQGSEEYRIKVPPDYPLLANIGPTTSNGIGVCGSIPVQRRQPWLR